MSAAAQRVAVGRRADFEEGVRHLVSVAGVEVGVLVVEGEFHAFENRCLHQGGPVCEGAVLGKVEVVLDDAGAARGERFSERELHLICPWHGFEYRLPSGECVALPGRHLRRFAVECEEDEVYVIG